MRVKRFIRVAHRWLAIALGLQVFLWIASGVVMSWFDIDVVRGDASAPVIVPRAIEPRNYALPGGVIAQMQGPVTELRLRSINGRLVYEAIGISETAAFDPQTGQKVAPLTSDGVRLVARSAYVGDAEIESVELLGDPPKEFRGPTPVWLVQYADPDRTRLYVSPTTGEVLARRTQIWRVYDFFWMLHIMDYKDRTDFNKPLLRIASLTGALFAISGLCLVGIRLTAIAVTRGGTPSGAGNGNNPAAGSAN